MTKDVCYERINRHINKKIQGNDWWLEPTFHNVTSEILCTEIDRIINENSIYEGMIGEDMYDLVQSKLIFKGFRKWIV